MSIDGFQVNKERIYRLEHNGEDYWPARLSADIQNPYPGVEATTRITTWEDLITKGGGQEEVRLEPFLLVDPAFFTIFSYEVREGNPETFLKAQNEVVLTESYARELFGSEPAVGKTIYSLNFPGQQVVVVGVVADFQRSHLKNPHIIASFESLRRINNDAYLDTYDSWGTGIYLLGKPGSDLPAHEAEINAYLDRELNLWDGQDKETVSLNSLRNIYFSAQSNPPAYARTVHPRLILILGITALLILVFAVVNYINLSIAQAGSRAKESAIRRLVGAGKRENFLRFIIEATLMCAVSLVIGLILARSLTPVFQSIMQTQLPLGDSMTATNGLILFGGILLLGFVSGWIPALIISRFNAIEIVRGSFQRKTKMIYSKVLIMIQYCITIGLLASAITITRQLDYMTSGDIGYNKNNIIVVTCYENAPERNGFRDQLLSIPGVETVGYSRAYPSNDYEYNTFQDRNGNNIYYITYCGDSSFMKMLDFDIMHRTGIEDPSAVWLSETAWKSFGLADNAIDFYAFPGVPESYFKIRGKIRDFHNNDFTQGIEPILIKPLQPGQRAAYVLIQVAPGNAEATFARVRDFYDSTDRGGFFDGQFLDAKITSQYQSQIMTSQILSSLTLVAVLLSSLGILAMAIYFSRQRAKEMALRKVFGATNGEVLFMLMTNFVKLTLIAFAIAVPVVWYLMSEWLSEYAYRIPLSWNIFALAGLTTIVIATLTVLWQSLKTANMNPVIAIKLE